MSVNPPLAPGRKSTQFAFPVLSQLTETFDPAAIFRSMPPPKTFADETALSKVKLPPTIRFVVVFTASGYGVKSTSNPLLKSML